MLKQYSWNGSTWQFEETEAPQGAVEMTENEKKPLIKAATPLNKAMTPENKTVKTKGKRK